MIETKRKRKSKFPLILFSLILIFNPNISIIDILPDYIAYFILAGIFLDASDKSPFFAEARSAFLKLAWLNLAKPFTLVVIAWSRSHNAFGNDMLTIASFVFAIGEFLLMAIAISNLFNALFRLGERTDASSLIAPLDISFNRTMSTDALKNICYIFALVKCAAYGLPDLLLLTTMKGVTIITVNPLYPVFLLLGITVALVIGIFWLVRVAKYAKRIAVENQFQAALDTISVNISQPKLDSIRKIRNIKNALTVFTIAFILLFELRLDNLDGVNLIPPPLFAIFAIIALISIRKYIRFFGAAVTVTGIYGFSSTLTYILESRFLTSFGYESLLKEAMLMNSVKTAAHASYNAVKISAWFSFVISIALIVILTLILRQFILDHTGISPKSQNYSKLEKDFHSALLTRLYILSGLAATTFVTKFAYLIFSGRVETVFTDVNDITQPSFVAPSVEWIGFATSAASIIFIAYMLYFFSLIKDETKMKYEQD